MSTYTEEHLVERPAIQLMQHELGWQVEAPRKEIAGIPFQAILESMKTTIDIPEAALADAMRFTGAKTKREAVVKALEEFNRLRRVKEIVAGFGTWDFASNDEIEAGDLEEIALREARTRKP